MHWEHYEVHRRENYQVLYETLKANPNLKVWNVDFEEPSRFVFPIRLVNGMTVKDAWELLSPKSVEIRTLMGGATCTQPAFKTLVAYDIQQNAIEMADTTFFVGIHQTLPLHDVQAVARMIDETFR